MPRVSIKTGIVNADGTEEVLHEYLCDWPNCGNVAEHLLGVIVELRAMVVMCSEHAAMVHNRRHGTE